MKYLLTNSVKHLHIPSVKVERKFFPEGELYVRVVENIKNRPITIVSNITPTNLLEVLFIVDAVKQAGGKIKSLTIPFMSYARQDKMQKYGEAISGEIICFALKNLKIPVKIFDLHSDLLKKDFRFKYRTLLSELIKKLPRKNFIIIAPDKGGLKRASAVAKILKTKVLMIKKKRKNGKVSMTFSKNLFGKDVLIVDDMISTGATLIEASKILKKNNAGEIYCVASHGLFVKNAREKIKKSKIKKIIVSNTLPVKPSDQIKVIRVEKVLQNK